MSNIPLKLYIITSVKFKNLKWYAVYLIKINKLLGNKFNILLSAQQ